MKALSFVLLLSLPLTLTAAEVQRGNTLDEVRATLGAPKGQVRLGDRHLLYYDRGEIELHAGTVTRVTLMSVEDLAALEARRAAEAVRVREEQEIRRARLSVEGEELMARKLADPAFRTAPPAYQVAFWEDFSRRYPEVPNAEQLAIARSRLTEQLEQRRVQAEQTQRLAELEARVSEAEARAAAAEYTSQPMTGYVSYSRYRPYARHFSTGWPVQYPASVNSWQSFATPLPVGHAPASDRPSRDNCGPDNNRWDVRGSGNSSDSGLRPFAWRNRL